MSDDLEDALETLEELEEITDSRRKRALIRRAVEAVRDASVRPVRGVARGFGWRDLAEAFIGSVVVGIPMLAEGGTLEIGAYLAGHPLHLAATLVFGLAALIGLLYGTKFRRVEVVNPIFGFIPRRVVGIVTVAFLTSLLLMAGWGRVDWSEPSVAWSQVAFVAVIMSIGAAISDILPSE